MVGDKWGVYRIAPDSDISNGNVKLKKGIYYGHKVPRESSEEIILLGSRTRTGIGNYGEVHEEVNDNEINNVYFQ